MKRIILLRHGKAESQTEEKPDFDRTLVEKGRSQTEKIALHAKKRGITPGVVISSPAKRALETAAIFARVHDYPEKSILQEPVLYGELDDSALLELIARTAPGISSAVIVGHDPSISAAAKFLAERFDGSLSTSSIAAIDFNIDAWRDVRPGAGALVYFESPKKDKPAIEKEEKEIEGMVLGALNDILAGIDGDAARRCENKLHRESERIARIFVKAKQGVEKGKVDK